MLLRRRRNAELAKYALLRRKAIIDEINSRCFLYLCQECERKDLSISKVIEEYLKGVLLVLDTLEGEEAVNNAIRRIELRSGEIDDPRQ